MVIVGLLIGLMVGGTLGVLILGAFAAGARDDAYLQGRLDELCDAARERV